MDDQTVQTTPLDPNPVDNTSANDDLAVESTPVDLSQYTEVKNSLGGGEKTPPLPEVHTQQTFTPEKQAAIAQDRVEGLADTRSQLRQEIAKDQTEAALQQEVAEQTQRFQLFHKFVDQANSLREGKFAEASMTMAACAMAMLPMLLEQKGISTGGMVDAAINIGPGALMGATMGKHLEPLNRAIGKDLNELKGMKAKAVKAGNVALGAAGGAFFGHGVGTIAHMFNRPELSGVGNLADDIALPAIRAASRVKEGASYLRQRVSTFRKTKEPAQPVSSLQQSEPSQ